MIPLGIQTPRYDGAPRSVIGAVETTARGNVVLRVGREIVPLEGWQQTEHVVLTLPETRELIDRLIDALLEPVVQGH